MWCLAVSTDGRFALTGGEDKTARCRNLETGQEGKFTKHESPVFAVGLSPDGKQRFRPDQDMRAAVWHTDSATEIRYVENPSQKKSIYSLGGSSQR